MFSFKRYERTEMNMYTGPSLNTFERSKLNESLLKSKSKSKSKPSNPSPKRKTNPMMRSMGRAKNTIKPRIENNAIDIPPRSFPIEIDSCADNKANIGEAIIEKALSPMLLINPINMRKNAPTVRIV